MNRLSVRHCPVGVIVSVVTVVVTIVIVVVVAAIFIPGVQASKGQHQDELPISSEVFGELGKPNFPRCGEITNEVGSWLEETLLQHQQLAVRGAALTYEAEVNITKYNTQKKVEIGTETDQWRARVLLSAKSYLASYANELQDCNATQLRMVELYWLEGALKPSNDEKRKLVNNLSADMENDFATTVVIKDGKEYRLDPELMDIMEKSQNYTQLLWAWQSWHDLIGPKVKEKFTRLVAVLNEAATDNGFSDAGEVWRLTDVEDKKAEDVMDEIMEQIDPLYKQLHAYVRRKLFEKYSIQIRSVEGHENAFDPDGPIPAHILGNMFSQEWNNVESLVTPFPDAPLPPDVTKALEDGGFTPKEIFKMAETFFVSLGFEPMTEVFWNKSIIERPTDPEVKILCHASAFDMHARDDFRMKMCTRVSFENLMIVHHEMGHIVYFMQYRPQPIVFRNGANSAFHEAVGDTIARSVATKKHLAAIGLIDLSAENGKREAGDKEQAESTEVELIALLSKIKRSIKSDQDDDDDDDDDWKMTTDENTLHYERDINQLMRDALNKVAFLPFAYSLEKWRYAVFRGDIQPEDYNTKWWEMREKYQGIIPPVERDQSGFDAGAKFHVAGNVPYGRYFFSNIGEFQFHETLCREAGQKGPLHNCDIYNSKKAGEKLRSMLRQGSSRPWRKQLEEFTGLPYFSAEPLLNYFRPLYNWLVRVNKGQKVGWSKG